MLWANEVRFSRSLLLADEAAAALIERAPGVSNRDGFRQLACDQLGLFRYPTGNDLGDPCLKSGTERANKFLFTDVMRE